MSIKVTTPQGVTLKLSKETRAEWNYKLFPLFVAADLPACISALHDFIFLLDGSHEAAGKYDANQLQNKTDKQFVQSLQCERFTKPIYSQTCIAVADSGEAPPLFLDQTEAAEKRFFGKWTPTYTVSQGLELALY